MSCTLRESEQQPLCMVPVKITEMFSVRLEVTIYMMIHILKLKGTGFGSRCIYMIQVWHLKESHGIP